MDNNLRIIAYLCNNRRCLQAYTIEQAELVDFICVRCHSSLAGVASYIPSEDGCYIDLSDQALRTAH